MLYSLRLALLGAHFLLAGAVNLVIVLLRPFNPDNSRLCGRVYSLPALRILGLTAQFDVHVFNKLGSVVPYRTVTIGKKSLRWIPIFGQIYWLAGNVLIERGDAAQAKQAMLKTTDTLAGLFAIQQGCLCGLPLFLVRQSAYSHRMD